MLVGAHFRQDEVWAEGVAGTKPRDTGGGRGVPVCPVSASQQTAEVSGDVGRAVSNRGATRRELPPPWRGSALCPLAHLLGVLGRTLWPIIASGLLRSLSARRPQRAEVGSGEPCRPGYAAPAPAWPHPLGQEDSVLGGRPAPELPHTGALASEGTQGLPRPSLGNVSPEDGHSLWTWCFHSGATPQRLSHPRLPSSAHWGLSPGRSCVLDAWALCSLQLTLPWLPSLGAARTHRAPLAHWRAKPLALCSLPRPFLRGTILC